MNKLLVCAILSGIALSSCKKINELSSQSPAEQLVAAESIDAFIFSKLNTDNKFEWNSASPEMVWSAAQHRDQLISIGYKPAGITDISNSIHQIDIHHAEWKLAKQYVIKQVLSMEKELDPSITIEKILVYDDETLPFINVVVKNLATIRFLRNSDRVRYTEPMAYEPQPAVMPDSDSGCGSNDADEGLVAGVDYTTLAPNAKQSWNYSYHGIPTAWTRTTGAGIKIFIIDTGAEFDQENLGTAFKQGSSAGRTVEKIVTLPRPTFLGIPTGPVETADDGCGHGTSMAGAAAGPRGTDGNVAGVAYNSNLVTCRASQDVLIDASREVTGVTNAYKNAADRADVKIISMSMGRITGSSQISDAINYAYGKGKLMFCAAGTSFGWTAGWYGVIFPAWLSNVNAVTGVRDNSFSTNCTSCHKGAETDF